MHPRIYSNISRQLSRAPFGELEEAHTAPILLNAVAKDLLKNGINWGKVISIYTMSGGLAIDIVRQGHYDYLPRLIQGTVDIIQDDCIGWLLDNGGWSGLLDHIRIRSIIHYSQLTVHEWVTILIGFLFILYILFFTAKSIGTVFHS